MVGDRECSCAATLPDFRVRRRPVFVAMQRLWKHNSRQKGRCRADAQARPWRPAARQGPELQLCMLQSLRSGSSVTAGAAKHCETPGCYPTAGLPRCRCKSAARHSCMGAAPPPACCCCADASTCASTCAACACMARCCSTCSKQEGVLKAGLGCNSAAASRQPFSLRSTACPTSVQRGQWYERPLPLA